MDISKTKAVIGEGAHFSGTISNAKSIEINGTVEADLEAEKVSIGPEGEFRGAIKSDLVVISGHYHGEMHAHSVWQLKQRRSLAKSIINHCKWIVVPH